MGIVDFDVLDAVEEFLDACEAAGVRGSAGIESRVFIPEFADREINSPGEPGVYYHMGIGFTGGALTPRPRPFSASCASSRPSATVPWSRASMPTWRPSPSTTTPTCCR